MSVSSLQVLADNRKALLLAEVAALLHDVGKLSSQFIDQMSTMPSAESSSFKHEKALQKPSFVNSEFLDVLSNKELSALLKFDNIQKNKHVEKLLDLILYHDNRNHSAFLVQLINRCDGIDSGADKGTTPRGGLPKEAKQERANTFIASAFGNETQKVDLAELDTLRYKLTSYLGQELTNITSKHIEIRNKVKSCYEKGLGETRRAANDVTLWCHSYSVATIYKTSLSTLLLRNGELDIDNLRWRLLRVNFDVLGLYAKAIKIADLLGYQRAVEQACETVKQLVEEEYPLGNEVYRDTTGIYFTFPDLDLHDDLAQEIRRRVEKVDMELAPRIAVTKGDGSTAKEQLTGILAKARAEAQKSLAQPFDGENLSNQWQEQWTKVGKDMREVCPVCRLRPMEEGGEACKICLDRRTSRIETWVKKPDQTIWMNEIADHNGRVALLVGRFGLDDWLSGDLVQTMLVRCELDSNTFTPKNPSPARLRRVWETCQRFWTETLVGKRLPNHEYGKGTKDVVLRDIRRCVVPENKNGWKDKVPYEGVVNGKPIELLWLEKDECFITIINLQLAGELKVGQTITLRDPEDPHKKFRLNIQSVEDPSEEMKRYKPFLPLLSSPDRFLALIPAADALDIAKKIREEYTRQFGKVQNRLPLFLGLVFFPRKTPLMAVMDAARRMLETPLSSEPWTVECCRTNAEGHNQYLRLSKGEKRLTFEVPIKMGDNKTEDVWYPYFFVENADESKRTRCFQLRKQGDTDPQKVGSVGEKYADKWLVHVGDLQKDDTVTVTPSRFAYLWMDHTARRFAFDPERDPLLLDELPRLMEMWDALKNSGITDTALHGVQALFERKRTAWGIGDEFEKLVETTLKREGLHNAIGVEDVVSERFARCLELYMHILKRKIKEDRDGAET